jgi:alkanesulfonate monooxygenase SsuD/methylene tetrahydromethanopterin reductase-like flavin-dependent oxidoreductase (luciferase family)
MTSWFAMTYGSRELPRGAAQLSTTSSFGLLLPHFGVHARPAKILGGAQRAEQLGFDSVWVRDHLLFSPHAEFENPSTAFLEALTVLTAVGASTERLTLGTAALIPFRHPLVAALVTTTMAVFFPSRLILGLGSGNDRREFEAVGLGDVDRPALVMRVADALRRLWAGERVTLDEGPIRFADASVGLRPPGGTVPLWYCGSTPKGARIAAHGFDGWMPARIPIETLRRRIGSILAVLETRPRRHFSVGIMPITAVDPDPSTALARVPVDGLVRTANAERFWIRPASGSFETIDDLEGIVLYGTPDDVVERCRRLVDAGVSHIVFDLRMSFDAWEDQMELLGTHVLPALRASTPIASTAEEADRP